MSIGVNLPPFLQQLAEDVKRVDVRGGTVGECLEELVGRYPRLKPRIFAGDGRLAKGLSVYINGENAYPGELARPVRDGDNLHLAHLIFGG